LFKLREAIMTLEIETLRTIAPPNTMPFEIRRLGHVVLQVSDLARSLLFYIPRSWDSK